MEKGGQRKATPDNLNYIMMNLWIFSNGIYLEDVQQTVRSFHFVRGSW